MATKIYPVELRQLIERATAGDQTALPELKLAFDSYPELVSQAGNLAQLAEHALLQLIAGTNLTAHEAITREAAALRERLGNETGTELERLLVERVVLSWLTACHGDIEQATHLMRLPSTAPGTVAAGRRLDQAHNRYLQALKTLATVRKLLRKTPSPIDLLRPVGETTTSVEPRQKRTEDSKK